MYCNSDPVISLLLQIGIALMGITDFDIYTSSIANTTQEI